MQSILSRLFDTLTEEEQLFLFSAQKCPLFYIYESRGTWRRIIASIIYKWNINMYFPSLVFLTFALWTMVTNGRSVLMTAFTLYDLSEQADIDTIDRSIDWELLDDVNAHAIQQHVLLRRKRNRET